MRELVRNIEKIEKSTTVLAEKLGGLERTVPAILTAAEDKTEDFNDTLQTTTDHLKDMTDLAEASFSKWEKAGQSLHGIFGGLTNVFQTLGGAIDGAGRYIRNLQRDPQGTLMNNVSQIPYAGPMLQVALESQFREDRFKTAGRQSVLQFQKTEGLDPAKVRETGAALGGEMKRLEESFLGKRDEVQAVWAAFAEGGAKSGEMTKKAGFEVKGFGDTVSQVALGVDKAFGQVAGTTAQLSNQIRQSSNVSLAESVELVKNLGAASHGTGQNMQSFVNTILQTTSALRVQSGDAKDLSNTYFKLQEVIKSTAAPGTSAARVSALAGSALGGLASFVQSMPQGMQALIGQDMAAKMHHSVDDLTGLRAFETGFQSQGGMQKGADFSKTAAELTFARLKKEGVAPGNDMYMALKAMGMPAQLADIVERAGGKLTGVDADKAAKEYEAKFKEVEKLQPLSSGDFEKVMDDIKNLMNSIGQMTIQLLATIAQALVSTIRVGADNTYSKEDALRDVLGRTTKLADEGEHASVLTKKIFGDAGSGFDVGSFMGPGTRQLASFKDEQQKEAGAHFFEQQGGGGWMAKWKADNYRRASTEGREKMRAGLSEEAQKEMREFVQKEDTETHTIVTNVITFKRPKKLVPRGDMPE